MCECFEDGFFVMYDSLFITSVQYWLAYTISYQLKNKAPPETTKSDICLSFSYDS